MDVRVFVCTSVDVFLLRLIDINNTFCRRQSSSCRQKASNRSLKINRSLAKLSFGLLNSLCILCFQHSFIHIFKWIFRFGFFSRLNSTKKNKIAFFCLFFVNKLCKFSVLVQFKTSFYTLSTRFLLLKKIYLKKKLFLEVILSVFQKNKSVCAYILIRMPLNLYTLSRTSV